MFQTRKADWYFIISATTVWLAALLVTTGDFAYVQQAVFRFRFDSLVGLTSMLLGIIVRRWAKMNLRKNFSPALRIRDDHQLVTNGIYKYIRHPAYSGNFLFWFGTPLLFSSFYGFLVMLLLIPCYLYRIKIEEKMLVGKFGEEYLEYMRHTKKLLPYIY